MLRRRVGGRALLALLALASGPAWANCSTPTGMAGDQIYNTSYNVMQFCNGTNWVNMGGVASGVTAAGSDGYVQFNTSNVLDAESALVWDKANDRLGIGTATPAKALDVVGTVNATGAVTFASTLGVTGDFTVNTNKFSVTAASGNTSVAGTLAVTGQSAFTGNVGIGTTSPAGTLDVYSGSGAAVALIRSTGTNTSWLSLVGHGTTFLTNSFDIWNDVNQAGLNQRAALPMTFSTNNSERLRIDSSGNVGIGTTSPAWPLQTYSSTNNTGIYAVSGHSGSQGQVGAYDSTASSVGIYMFSGGGGNSGIATMNNAGAWTSTPLNFTSAGNSIFNGNVGIGTTAPLDVANVKGNGTGQIGFTTASTSESIGLNRSPTNGTIFNTGHGAFDIGNYSGVFQITPYDTSGTSHSQFTMLSSNGNVGIGTTSPSSTLHVAGDLRIANDLLIYGGSKSIYANSGFLQFGTTGNYPIYFGTNNNLQRMTMDASGNVGIGTTSPQQVLDVNGYIRFGGTLFSSARANFYVGLQGDRNMVLYDNGAAIWSSGTSTSDIRVKEQIRPLEPILDKLAELRTVRFRYKRDVDEKQLPQIGVIAQEVEKVFPEFVYRAKDPKLEGGRLLVYYDKLSAVLLKGVQELKAANDNQAKRLEALEAEFKAYKAAHP